MAYTTTTRRNRNEEFYRTLLSLSLAPSTDRFTSPSPSFLSPSRSLPARSKAPSHCGRCAPDLPTLAVMQYETRNDESAYVSHVMEIPLLIRALNDSTTAGYITCIITLMAAGIYGRKEGEGKALLFSLSFFVCRHRRVRVIIDRWRGDRWRTSRRPDGNDLCNGL